MGADKSNTSIQEEVRKLRAENEMLRKVIKKKSEEEIKIDKLVKKSQETWVQKQIANNIVDLAFDKLQSYYEKELGIDDE